MGDLALALGYRQEFNSGMVIGVSFLPTLMSGETWADPYLETERTTTDESGNAYRFQLENIAGSRFSLDLAYATTEVDEEQSGSALNDAEEQAQLDRDGSSIYAKGSYKFSLGHGSALIPSLTYVNHSADGKAMSYDSYKGELSYRQKIERHSFAVTTSYTNRSYDGSNPLFNETRSDDEYSLFVAYEYQNVFGWDHWSLVSFAGYSASSSNIEFYDEEEYLMSVGMNYKF